MIIKLKKSKLRKGHPSHLSGSGEHSDRRTKREKTRQAIKKKVFDEY
jgi:hypothetical protein